MSARRIRFVSLIWAWSAVVLAVLAAASTLALHASERRVVAQASSAVETLREARLALLQGYLHLRSSGEPDSPFDHARGEALLAQAFAIFEESAARMPDVLGRSQAIEAFKAGLARLAESLDAHRTPGPSADVETRLALFDLERLAERLDQEARMELRALAKGYSRLYVLSVLLSAVLLVTVGLVVLRSLRLAETSRIELAESLGRSEALALDLQARDETIRRDLEEKTVLLREVHHRVKNNLQVVSSLLALEATEFGDPAAREALERSQERIFAMSLAHELLYASSDLRSIDFGDFSRRLVLRLADRREQSGIELALEPLSLDIDRALPCALFLREATDNALTHGQRTEAALRLRVSLEARDGQGLLEIEDNGPGLPSGIDPERSESLGLSLMRSLASQAEGRVEWLRPEGRGLTVRLRFPLRAEA